MPRKVYVVDYDIPTENPAKRRMFYRHLDKLLQIHGLIVEKSTQSVWILDNREVAESIHALASSFGSSRIYEAKAIEQNVESNAWRESITQEEEDREKLIRRFRRSKITI